MVTAYVDDGHGSWRVGWLLCIVMDGVWSVQSYIAVYCVVHYTLYEAAIGLHSNTSFIYMTVNEKLETDVSLFT